VIQQQPKVSTPVVQQDLFPKKSDRHTKLDLDCFKLRAKLYQLSTFIVDS
jgi:hypothetical protein